MFQTYYIGEYGRHIGDEYFGCERKARERVEWLKKHGHPEAWYEEI